MSYCQWGPILDRVGVLASVSLPAGVFIVTPVIVLFRGFLGVVGLTWGDLGVWGCLVITGRDPTVLTQSIF